MMALPAAAAVSVGAATQVPAAQVTGAQVPAAQPAVTGISPTRGPEAGGTTVTVSGAGLTGATAVMFGSTPGLNVIIVNDTTVTAIAPPHAPGTVDVTVTSPTGTSGISRADQYTYKRHLPHAPAAGAFRMHLQAAPSAVGALRLGTGGDSKRSRKIILRKGAEWSECRARSIRCSHVKLRDCDHPGGGPANGEL